MNMVGDGQVPQHHSTATHRAVRANHRAARNAHTTGHGGMRTNAHVVPNLDEVVQLHTVFNHGVFKGAAVNAGVGANFNVITDFYRA